MLCLLAELTLLLCNDHLYLIAVFVSKSILGQFWAHSTNLIKIELIPLNFFGYQIINQAHLLLLLISMLYAKDRCVSPG